MKSGKTLYKCNLCGKIFDQAPNLEFHIRIHTKEKPFNCDRCSYTAAQISHIDVHKRTRDPKGSIIPCPKCDFIFCTIKSLGHHQRKIHRRGKCRKRGDSAERNEKIPKAGPTVQTQALPQPTPNLKKPFPNNSQNSGFCPRILRSSKKTCGTASETSRTEATSAAENKANVVSNPNNKTTKRSTEISNSVSSATPIVLVKRLRTIEPVFERPKPFKNRLCRFCPYRTRRADHLKLHLSVHTGEKPYACPHCAHRALTRAHLTRHLRTHLKMKPPKIKMAALKKPSSGAKQKLNKDAKEELTVFRCKYCSYESSDRYRVLRHLPTHVYFKPLACEFCDYRTHRKDRLKGHMRVHENLSHVKL